MGEGRSKGEREKTGAGGKGEGQKEGEQGRGYKHVVIELTY